MRAILIQRKIMAINREYIRKIMLAEWKVMHYYYKRVSTREARVLTHV